MTRLPGGVFLTHQPCMANVERLDLNAMPMVCQMGKNGLLCDREHFRQLSEYFSDKLEGLHTQIQEVAGYPIDNPGSGDQVADLLFHKLKVQGKSKVRMTKKFTREQADEEALQKWKMAHPVVGLLIEYSKTKTLKASFCDKLPLFIGSDGRVRPNYKVAFVETGRMSCEDPNLMGIPVRTDDGKLIRSGFIAPDGWRHMSSDLSQIELRWVAAMSKDPNMTRVFVADEDLHTATAMLVFKVDMETVKKNKDTMRDPCKNINFGIIYGLTPEGLQDQIVTRLMREGQPLGEWGGEAGLEKCAKLIRMWLTEAYPKVGQFMDAQHAIAARYGFVWDAWGRIRRIPEVYSVHSYVRSKGLRNAGNFPIQAGAQGVIKLCMYVLEEIRQQWYAEVVKPLLQIHDELVYEVREDVVEEWEGVNREVMSNIIPPELLNGIPLGCGVAVAHTWGGLK